MSRPRFGVAFYRFRATFRRRWPGLLVITLLIGLLGGLALASVAGARRTQSSFPTFLESTNPSDLIVLHNDSINDSNATDAAFLRAIARLPHVEHVESVTAPSQQLLDANGFPARTRTAVAFDSTVDAVGDVNGLLSDQDRPVVVAGRALDPTRADEMVMSPAAAEVLHVHVGDVVHFGFYTDAQTLEPGYGTPKQVPVRRVAITVVGLVAFHFDVVRDDIDRSVKFALFSPALTRPLNRCCANTLIAGLQLDGGGRAAPAVEAEIKQLGPNDAVIRITSVDEATAERAIEPESVALAVFGAIAALATLVIAGQAIGRQLRVDADDLDAMRALGAAPRMLLVDGLIGVVGAIVAGAVVAAGVAVALSPLAPLGPVRPVYPDRGVAFDWTVIGVGIAALIVVSAAIAVSIAYRRVPHRIAARSQWHRSRGSLVAGAATSSGLPVSAVAGIRLALESGRDARSVPVRSVIVGASLAVVVLVATVVFGSSLDALVTHPALYGWNWSYELLGTYGGQADVPQPQTGQLLAHDPDVAGWAGVSFDNLRIDGQTVPVLGATPNDVVGPPILSGHSLQAANQVLLGATTRAQLRVHLGDTVELENGSKQPARLVVVGTATLPAIGSGDSLHLEIGTGAVVSEGLIPKEDRSFGDLKHDSPEAVLVRFRRGADPRAALARLQKIASEVDVNGHGPPAVVSPQRPAEIVNYRAMGTTPALLGGALAFGAVVALGLTLLASVRRRRRDLALLKTLGFTRRQLATTVVWQASVAVIVGLVVGVPLGIVIGRTLWGRFATALHVVPEPIVPVLTITLIAIAALVLAGVVAAVPGRRAARVETGVLLRAE